MSSLWIINKAGGLIYQAEHFVHPNAASMPNNGRLSSNEYLVLAGTLHGIHAITAKLNPVPNRKCSGIESLDSDHFTIRVMVTPTGKFRFLSHLQSLSRRTDSINLPHWMGYRHKVRPGDVAGASEPGRSAASMLRGVCGSCDEEPILHARDAGEDRDVRQGRRSACQGVNRPPAFHRLRVCHRTMCTDTQSRLPCRNHLYLYLSHANHIAARCP